MAVKGVKHNQEKPYSGKSAAVLGEAQSSKKLSETSLRRLRKKEEQSGYYLVVREAKH